MVDALLLAAPDRFGAVMTAAGIGDGTSLVLYDDTVSYFAARIWWSLRAYGFESARILDGGFPEWAADGRPISNAEVHPPATQFTPRAQMRLRLTTADIRSLLGSGDVMLLDARAPAEYKGLEGNSRRLGHIPGAVNVPVALTTRPGEQRFRDPDELRDVLHRSNVSRGRRMICYDGSGVAAAARSRASRLSAHATQARCSQRLTARWYSSAAVAWRRLKSPSPI